MPSMIMKPIATVNRRRPFRWERGQSLTEFALVLPILILALTGAIDLGRVYFAYVTITNAAREGARYGATDRFTPDGSAVNVKILERAINEATGGGVTITSANIEVACFYNTDTSMTSPKDCTIGRKDDYGNPANGVDPGDQIRVAIYFDFPPILSQVLGWPTVRIRNSAVMAILI